MTSPPRSKKEIHLFRASHNEVRSLAKVAQKEESWVQYVVRQVARRRLHVWIADEAGTAVGYVLGGLRTQGTGMAQLRPLPRFWWHSPLAQPEALLMPGTVGDIREIFVVPELRRQGIGTTLIRQCIEDLYQHRVRHIEAALPASKPELQHFFQQSAFRQAQIRVHKYLRERNEAAPCDNRFIIRPAARRDVPSLVHLYQKQIHQQQALASDIALLDQIDWQGYIAAKLRDAKMQILIVEQQGRLCGFSELWSLAPRERGLIRRIKRTMVQLPQQSSLGVVQEIYVASDLRQRGLASALLAASHRWFEQQGVQEVQAAIWFHNASSRQFFQKFGYATISHTMHLSLG